VLVIDTIPLWPMMEAAVTVSCSEWLLFAHPPTWSGTGWPRARTPQSPTIRITIAGHRDRCGQIRPSA